jgi:tRNA 2-thiouridine synthesizing protein A
MPVVKASEALKGMAPGELLEVLADDQGVKADFPAFCKSAGHTFLGFTQEGRTVRSFIRKGGRETRDERRGGVSVGGGMQGLPKP